MNTNFDSMDLVSMISGSAQDFKLVLDYLPTYLTQFTRFYNVMFGVSLGGHTAWRIASLTSPGQFYAYTMVVGCPSLSTLLLGRLGIDPTIGNSPGEPFDFEKLRQAMNPQQQKRWPRALAEMVVRDDRQVTDEFPDVPLLLCNGKYDKLVPAKYTTAWVEERQRRSGGKQDITFFIQDNTGHSCTKEMVAMTAEWLRDILPSSSPQQVS
jgi:pimeloyl-ACP methyl ester carboxylesterase